MHRNEILIIIHINVKGRIAGLSTEKIILSAAKELVRIRPEDDQGLSTFDEYLICLRLEVAEWLVDWERNKDIEANAEIMRLSKQRTKP